MRTEQKLITPEIAKKYLERNKTNRPISKNTVSKYAYEMTQNLWKLTGQGISIDENNNLVDGQHRLLAVIKSGKSIKTLVVFDVPAETFICYDSGKNRSAADVFGIEGIKYHSALSTGVRNFIYFCQGMLVRAKGHGYISKSELLDKYYQHSTLWDDLVVDMKANTRGLNLFTFGIILGFSAFLIISKRHKYSIVMQFIKELYGKELDTMSCTKSLRIKIVSDSLSGRDLKSSMKTIYLAKCWNSYKSKKDISKFIVKDTTVMPDIL